MRNKKGVSLFHYVITIALIGLLVVPVYFVCGESIKNSLESFYKSLVSINNNIDMNSSDIAGKMISNSLKAGELGGTPSNPIRKCAGDVCSIDYGNLIVNGIPADYNGFVESSGSSGATDRILSLMDQLVKQMEANPDDYTNDQVQKIKGLIARGKDIIQLEKHYETLSQNNLETIKEYTAQEIPLIQEIYDEYKIYTAAHPDCLSDGCTAFKNQPNIALKRDQLHSIMTQMTNVANQFFDSSQSFKTFDNKEIALNASNVAYLLDPSLTPEYSTNPDGTQVLQDMGFSQNPDITVNPIEGFLDGTSPIGTSMIGQYLKELKEINSDSTYDSSLKQISNALSKEIYNLSQEVRTTSHNYNFGVGKSAASSWTTVMGEFDPNTTKDAGFVNILNELNKKPSERTRLDLGIICSSHRGEFNPDNVNCK